MKLCKDCKHLGGDFRCHEPSVGPDNVDPVTGKETWRGAYSQRSVNGRCGEQAVLFVPRRGWFGRLR